LLNEWKEWHGMAWKEIPNKTVVRATTIDTCYFLLYTYEFEHQTFRGAVDSMVHDCDAFKAVLCLLARGQAMIRYKQYYACSEEGKQGSKRVFG
jgi:hypothetical protein